MSAVASVHPKYIQLPSSTFAIGSKLSAIASVHPGKDSILSNSTANDTPPGPEKTGSDKLSIVQSPSIVNRMPVPASIKLPENEKPISTEDEEESVNPAASAEPPEAPETQPSWAN